jgi:hypothetical protein
MFASSQPNKEAVPSGAAFFVDRCTCVRRYPSRRLQPIASGSLDPYSTTFAHRDGADFARILGARSEPIVSACASASSCCRIVIPYPFWLATQQSGKRGPPHAQRARFILNACLAGSRRGSPRENCWTSSQPSHGEPPRASDRSRSFFGPAILYGRSRCTNVIEYGSKCAKGVLCLAWARVVSAQIVEFLRFLAKPLNQ